jgi:hypothetical protein
LVAAVAEAGVMYQELVAVQVVAVLPTLVQELQELQVKEVLEEMAANTILLAVAAAAVAQVLLAKRLVLLEELQKDPMALVMVALVY